MPKQQKDTLLLRTNFRQNVIDRGVIKELGDFEPSYSLLMKGTCSGNQYYQSGPQIVAINIDSYVDL